jgi:transcriptional regulator with XRE-family HTH domain
MSLFNKVIESIPSVTKKYVDRQVGFATTVAEKLQSRGITQRQLAEQLGKKESYISRVLSGDANPTLKTISELEVALGEDVISFNLEKSVATLSSVIMFSDSFKFNLTGNDELKAA